MARPDYDDSVAGGDDSASEGARMAEAAVEALEAFSVIAEAATGMRNKLVGEGFTQEQANEIVAATMAAAMRAAT